MLKILAMAVLVMLTGCSEPAVRIPAEPQFVITEFESRSATTPESSSGNATSQDAIPAQSHDATPQPTDGAGRDSIATTPYAVTVYTAPYAVTVYSARWCVPCAVMKQREGVGNADVRFTWVEAHPPAGVPEMFPVCCWRDREGVLRYRVGATTAADLLTVIQRNDPPPREVLP